MLSRYPLLQTLIAAVVTAWRDVAISHGAQTDGAHKFLENRRDGNAKLNIIVFHGHFDCKMHTEKGQNDPWLPCGRQKCRRNNSAYQPTKGAIDSQDQMAPRLSCCDRYAMFRLLSVILPGLILVLLASWGSYEAHKDSKCDMSFMRPVFIRLNFTTPTAEQAALNSTVPFVSGYAYKYRLFRYMDGYGEHSSLLGGYPVLFLPGNRGRSVAWLAQCTSVLRGHSHHCVLHSQSSASTVNWVCTGIYVRQTGCRRRVHC